MLSIYRQAAGRHGQRTTASRVIDLAGFTSHVHVGMDRGPDGSVCTAVHSIHTLGNGLVGPTPGPPPLVASGVFAHPNGPVGVATYKADMDAYVDTLPVHVCERSRTANDHNVAQHRLCLSHSFDVDFTPSFDPTCALVRTPLQRLPPLGEPRSLSYVSLIARLCILLVPNKAR